MPTKKWREDNVDRMRAYRRKWYADNAEHAKAAVIKRRDGLRAWFSSICKQLCAGCRGNAAQIKTSVHAGRSRARIERLVMKIAEPCERCRGKLKGDKEV